MSEADVTKRIEGKLDEILKRLDRIEGLLGIEEVPPEEDELEEIRDYLKEKMKGNLELIPLSEVFRERKE